MSSPFPSFQLHPSSPNMALSSSPGQQPHLKLGSRVVRLATPASSSPIGKKTAFHAPSAAKRLVLGNLHPNSALPSKAIHRRKLVSATKVVSGYATPTSSSPVRPTQRHSDNTPSSPVPVGTERSGPLLASIPSFPVTASKISIASDHLPQSASETRPSSSSSSTRPEEVLYAPLPLSTTHTLLLGRTRSIHPLQPKQFNAIPPEVVACLKKPYNAILRLPLPRTAKHASRVHVVVELLEPTLARVLVLGQNGARVNGRRIDTGKTVLVDASRGGEVRAEGSTGEILKDSRKSSSGLSISFWGVEVVFPWPVVETNAASDDEETGSEDYSSEDSLEMGDGMDIDSEEEEEDFLPAPRPSGSSVLPPSSPPLSSFSSPQRRPSTISSTPSLSPTSSSLAHLSPPRAILSNPPRPIVKPQKPSMPPPLFKPEPKEETAPTPAPPPKPTRPAPAGVDLASLLSSSLVFSHVTSLAVPDLVRAVFETQPSLKEHGSEEDWEAWVHEEVNKGGMWGRVIRRGKVCCNPSCLSLA